MRRLLDYYTVRYNDRVIGSYQTFDNNTVTYYVARDCPWDIGDELSALGLDQTHEDTPPLEALTGLIKDEKRVPGRKRIIYQNGALSLERKPESTNEHFSVYRRNAEKGEPDYSPLPHDAPHYEGPHTPEGMREWASHYRFNKMDDGTYEAELDEAWWWGGGHNDGGTIHTEIPEEWFKLPYDDFLSNVVTLAAAAHYGFTTGILKEKTGLKEFFGY